jgi:hypothetical protein
MSVVEMFAHLPLVRLGDSAAASVADGELAAPDFDAWRELDDEFPWADRHYDSTQPVFYAERLDDAENADVEEIAARLDRQVDGVYRALLLATAVRLPSPRFSIRYLSYPERGACHRVVGPFDREYVLYRPDPLVVVDDALLGRVRATLALLLSAARLTEDSELGGALAALERTARPEFPHLNAFVHSMIALEELLMPDVRQQLTATFARRGGALLASGGEDYDDTVGWFRHLYHVRSAALHGEPVEDDPQLFAAGRAVLAYAICHALAYCTATGRGLDALRDELESVRADTVIAFREGYAHLVP